MTHPSPTLVARAKLAGVGSINNLIEKKWLPEVGAEIVKRVGGHYKVGYKDGFAVAVTTSTPKEVIGVRVNPYRNKVILHYVFDGDAEVVDSKRFLDILKLEPVEIAEWAVDETRGRNQTDLPFNEDGREGRMRARVKRILNEENREKSYNQRQRARRFQELMELERIRGGYRS